MITFPNDESKRKFKQLRNETKKKQIAIEKLKLYDNELGNSNDSKRMFQVFNKFCGKKKTISSKLEANDLNNFFVTIVPQLSKKLGISNILIQSLAIAILLFSFPLTLTKWQKSLRI